MCLADDFKIQGLTSHSDLSGYSFYLPLIQAWALERPTTWNQQQQIKESVSLIKWPERKSPMHIKEGILSPFPHLSQCSPSFHNEVRAWYLWVSIQRLRWPRLSICQPFTSERVWWLLPTLCYLQQVGWDYTLFMLLPALSQLL